MQTRVAENVRRSALLFVSKALVHQGNTGRRAEALARGRASGRIKNLPDQTARVHKAVFVLVGAVGRGLCGPQQAA